MYGECALDIVGRKSLVNTFIQETALSTTDIVFYHLGQSSFWLFLAYLIYAVGRPWRLR